MRHYPALLCLLAAILLAWLCIHFESTPASVNSSPADTAFSEPKAMAHLEAIASGPHSAGTPAHAATRAYILAACANLGLDTSIQSATTVISLLSGVVSERVHNITARLKGTNSDQTVLIAAHYDSQPNAGGAGDDGAACAAMLETARCLKAGHPLKNDILFLFTDGEEDDLLGASAFVRESPLLKEVGLVLNFDARGSSGASMVAETNSMNGWVVDGYAHGAAHRNASSLNYEIYKLLPNNTDYTPFKSADIAGLNMAFIDGFVDYHSISDKPHNLDPRTLQETGDNMVSLARYFGSRPITVPRADDKTFFNIIGDWFVLYPASLNILFIVLTNILLLAGLILGFIKKQIKPIGFLAGFLAFPVILTLLYFISGWMLSGIRAASPLYFDYYSNTYHPGYYYLSVAALGIAVFTLCYRWLLTRFSMTSLFAGILLVLVLVLDGLYAIMPTAIYFLCFPLLVLLAGACFTWFRRPSSSPVAALIFSIPALLFLAPIGYMFFIVFDLQPTAAAVPPVIAILLGCLLPLLSSVFRESRWLLPGGSFALAIISLTFGLLHRSPTPAEPIKTNLNYFVNIDSNNAKWLSLIPKTNPGNQSAFTHPNLVSGSSIFPGGFYGLRPALTNAAPLVDHADPTLTLTKDTIQAGRRLLTLHFRAAPPSSGANSNSPGINSVRFQFSKDNPSAGIIVDGRTPQADPLPGTNAPSFHHYGWLEYKAVPVDGFDIVLSFDPKKTVEIFTLSRSIGLPHMQDFAGFPPGYIPGPETYSNTTLVSKKFTF